MFRDLKEFIITIPRIPDPDKEYRKTVRLNITNENSREEILEEVAGKSEHSELAGARIVHLQKNGQHRLASFH